ncbi:MAG: hypothetical protein JSV86_10645 [Gemmatimonadota bacterium]|nr:MAG: hypothetical protein JSV86_10645 [Gemmatimonadota bacterium]
MSGPEFTEKTGVAPGTTTITLGTAPVALRVEIIAAAIATTLDREKATGTSSGLLRKLGRLTANAAERAAVRQRLEALLHDDGTRRYSDEEINKAIPAKPPLWRRKALWGSVALIGVAAGAYFVVTRRHRAKHPEQYELVPSAPRASKWAVPVQSEAA